MNHLEHLVQWTSDNAGPKAALDELAEQEQRLKSELAEVQRLRRMVQGHACNLELAAWVMDEPRELAPTKAQFIELYGSTEFDRVKRWSAPKKVFTWLI